MKKPIVSNSLQNTHQQSATTIPDNKTQQAVVALSQRTDMEQPGQANVTPTIQQPISTDSTGALKLKGNATPNSHILLLLNGRKVTSVQVTPTGQWNYETYLIPGEYSVQVKNDQNLKRSKSYQIVTSKPQIQWSNPAPKPKTTQPAAVISNTAKMSTRSSKNRLYRVKPGDTLYTLSKRYAVTVNEITRANQISDKDQISIGQMLKIPKR
jgi:LysM repeat protein